MNFSINPQLFSAVFVLPAAVVQEHLKLASGAQLKVLLAVCSAQNMPLSVADVAQKTGLPEAEVSDCLAFWEQKGVLTDLSAPLQTFAQPAPATVAAVEESKPKEPAKMPEEAPAQTKQSPKKTTREKVSVAPSRPTHAQICERLDECAALRELFNEIQTVLGRMLGTGDQAAFLLLFDYYGLPADVILMLCEYANTMGKAGNINYIYAVGQDWSEREIDTFERADEEIRRLSEVDENWSQFCALTGLSHAKPTKSQQNHMRIWLNEWHFSLAMIALAFEKMKERTDSVRFSYMNGILKKWYEKGIRSTEQVEKEEQDFLEKQTSRPQKTAGARSEGVSPAVAKSGTAGTPASYDLEKAEQLARTSVPTLKKRKKKEE